MTAPKPDTESAFTFLPRGAIIQEFKVAGHNIVQSFPEAALYASVPHPYFGETIGRTTNRIKDATLTNLNNRSYRLYANNGANNLHGGRTGWGKRDWKGPELFLNKEGREGVQFTYRSADGEEGFPGEVEARVWYVGYEEAGKTVLEVEYEAEMVGENAGVEETVVGMTNHSYFNLNLPAPTIEGTIITLATPLHQEISPDGIPTGTITPHPSVPPQPNTPFTLGATAPDTDDCFILNPDAASIPLDTRTLPLRTLITLSHPASKLHLEIASTEPAFQFYCGRFVDVPEVETSTGEKVPARGKRSGLCVEPSRYVDAAGREEWRGMCRLRKGERFGARNVYRGWRE